MRHAPQRKDDDRIAFVRRVRVVIGNDGVERGDAKPQRDACRCERKVGERQAERQRHGHQADRYPLKEKSRHSAEFRNCVMLPTLLAPEASPDRLMPAKDL